MPTETAVRATLTSTIKDLLATNTDDPDGFIDINYDRRIDHAVRILSARIPLIDTLTLEAASPLPYTWTITAADFADLIAVEYPATPNEPPTYVAANITHDGTNPQISLYQAQITDIPIGSNVRVWHTKLWSLPNLPAYLYPTIAEGAAGYAMRAQALAFVRQATIRPDNARLMLTQADAAITRFYGMVEQARSQRHRLQTHNDNVLGLRLNDTKLALDAGRIANLQSVATVAATLLRLDFINPAQANALVRSFDDELIPDPPAQ